MKLQVAADAHQYTLTSGTKVLGYYTSCLGLLQGARQALKKDKTKAGADLREWIEKGIAHEKKVAQQLEDLAVKTKGNLP